MHCQTLLTLSLALTANAQAQGATTRQERGGLGTSQYESVSAEPLTFSVAEPEPTDRTRLLAEAEIANGAGAFDWMEDSETEDFDDNMGLMDMNEDFEDYDDEDFEEFFEGDQQEDALYEDQEDGLYEEEPEADFADSTYVSEDGVDFQQEQEEDVVEEEGDEFEMTEYGSGEGFDDIGDGLEFHEPIARKLRRRLDNPKIARDEERRLAEKESLRDDSVPIFEPVLDENGEFEIEPEWDPEEDALRMGDPNHRDLQQACSGNQQRARVQIITDNSGFETSWSIRKSNGALISKGPANGRNYADKTQYNGSQCLSPGTYRFTVLDKFNDGMCGGNTGQGLYRFYLNGNKKFTSPSNCSVDWGKRVHTFTIRAANNQPNPSPTPAGAISGRGGCQTVKVQFKVDKYGKETSVTLSGNGSTHLSSVKNVGAYQTKTMTKCVAPGTYTLRLVDQDGICCNQGKGWYKMFVNGQRVISGGYFVGSKSHTIKIGTNWQSSMGSRAKEWLNAHNGRRRKYNGGAGYVALRWSRTLAVDAKNYANTLGNNCKNGQLTHAKNIQDGENLAKNSGSGNWGGQYTADKIMGRWVENELSLGYPANAHYTQVVWRATQYVGCGESVRNLGNNQMCRIQVCRYARAGNCNVRNGNWRGEAWKDDTGCGRPCPKEGCFV